MTSDPTEIPETPQEAAGRWFALKRSGEMSAQEAREMRVWLDRDGAHRAALAELEQVWDMAAHIRSDPQIMALREAEARNLRPRRRRRSPMLWGAIAASALILAGGGWVAFNLVGLDLFGGADEQEFHTGVGQRTTATLSDGSVITLDTDSAVRTRETGRKRLVQLERGRAFFRVAKDHTRPFIVDVGGRTVTATGTAFDVRAEDNGFQVTLVEGRVTVQTPRGQFWRGQSADMLAGWRLVARDDGQWTVNRIDVSKETGWLQGRLTFDDDPLERVVAELNRYSTRKIIIRDARIAQAPVVGGFKAGDVDGFVRVVQAYRLARVVSSTSKEVELGAPQK